jgi:hypothetical protein
MQIRLKLMGFLKDKTPADGSLEVGDQATINEVLAQLEIPANYVQVLTVNASSAEFVGEFLLW